MPLLKYRVYADLYSNTKRSKRLCISYNGRTDPVKTTDVFASEISVGHVTYT